MRLRIGWVERSTARAGVALLLALALVACRGVRGADPGAPPPTPERGAVVSEHPLATEVGLELLARGGNAADAAVGTALALAVVYPQAGNLGGGGFALWVPHGRPDRAAALDFRETAPRALTADAFLDANGRLDAQRALASHFAVGVPGSAAGLEAFHARFGRLSFERVAAPAIRMAREGYRVDAWLARDLRDPVLRARLEASASSRAIWYPRGTPLAENEIVVQPELAETLALLAREGSRKGFYSGPVADALVAQMRTVGAPLSHGDLEDYEPVWRTPLGGWFRGHLVIGFPPPSSGGVLLLQFLAVLDGFPLQAQRQRVAEGRTQDGWAEPETRLGARAVHWWIEALRRAFADRAEHLGDPDHVHVPVEALLSPDWIATRRVSIGERADPDVRPFAATPHEGGGETTHLSVLDDEGNAVSLTTTLNTSFGTGLMAPGTGFLLNNELDDFALVAGVPNEYGLVGSQANALAPGKRPLSSMSPTVVLDENLVVRVVIGSPGGPRIITAVAQVLLRHLVYGQSIDAAVRAPRLHQQWRPARTWLEPGWATGLATVLEERGHEIEISPSRFASVQAIAVEPGGEPRVASDPRRGGSGGVVGGARSRPARPPGP